MMRISFRTIVWFVVAALIRRSVKKKRQANNSCLRLGDKHTHTHTDR